ncbi:MAG: branched-chain amino acid ABC transporter permease [Desulfobacteraceae bacterium]|nr:branched-chain amino acid ABC transporter permease [Desulfobacteraceae bacterium]
MTDFLILLVGQLMNGFVFGMILALIAMGLSIIFGLMDIINFAHGAYYSLGAYVALTAMGFIDNFWLALLVVPATVMLVGFFVEFVLLRPLYGKDPVFSLLLNFGVMLAIIQVIRLVWGVDYKPFSPPDGLSGSVYLAFMHFSVYRLFVVAVCISLAILVWLLLKKTSLGMTVRAAVDKRDMVRALGINVSAVFTLVFGIGVALAGLGGALAAPLFSVYPEMGLQILVESFVVVVIGGMGSFKGSIVAGIIVGEIMALTTLWYPEMSQVAVYVFMAIFLLTRPQGLFGSRI